MSAPHIATQRKVFRCSQCGLAAPYELLGRVLPSDRPGEAEADQAAQARIV
jgi:hypothetical protein